MSTKKRPKEKKRSGNLTSILIPIVVGLVVVAIIVGAVLANEKRPTVAAAGPTLSVPIVTAAPLPTTEIPYPDVARISVKDAKNQFDKGKAILVDVRTKEAYDQAHADGAISIPEAEVNSRLNELPNNKLIILYCT